MKHLLFAITVALLLGGAGLSAEERLQQELKVQISYADGRKAEITVKCRIDTPIEIDYYRHGGILPYVLREILEKAGPAKARAA